MPNRHAAKGDNFERLLVEYLRAELGPHLTRPRCGATDDRGDIAGIPGWTVEAKCWADPWKAISQGLLELEIEQANAGTRHGLLVVKRPRVAAPERQLAVMSLAGAAVLMADTQRRHEGPGDAA